MTTPLVVARPGMPALEVESISSTPLRVPAHDREHATMQPHAIHAFELRADEGSVTFPSSRFTLLEVRYGVVHTVLTTAQENYLGPEAARARIEEVGVLLASVGFEHAGGLSGPLLATHMKARDQVHVSRWASQHRFGRWDAEISVRCTLRKGETFRPGVDALDDLCLVSVRIWDELRRRPRP